MVKTLKNDRFGLFNLLKLCKQRRKFLKTIAKIAKAWYNNCVK